MAQPIPPEEYDTIVALVARFPDAVAVGELQHHLTPKPQAQDLARCLAKLTRQRRIEVVAGTAGEPNARYRAVAGRAQTPDQTAVDSPSAAVAKSGDKPPPAVVPPAVSQPAQPHDVPRSDPGAPPAHGLDNAGVMAGAAPSFDEVVREVVRDIVLSLAPKAAAIGVAQTQAAILKWNSAQTAALLARVEEELRRVTPENASMFGVVPEQVRAWRKAYDAIIAPPSSSPSREEAAPAAKPGNEAVLPPSTAPVPPKNAGRSNARAKPEPTREHQGNAKESAAGVENASSADADWRLPAVSKDSVSAVLAQALGTASAGALSRAFGDTFTGKQRIALGGAIAATLLSIFQPFANSGWVKIGVPIAVALAFIAYTGRSRSAATSGNGVVTTPGLRLRELITRYRWLLGAGCVLALGAFAAWTWYQRAVLRPSKAAISEYLTSSVAPAPVRIVELGPTYGKPTSTGCPVTYQALFESTEPLYQRVDAASYLREHATTELAAIDAADVILRGPNGSRILTAIGTNAPAGWPIDRAASLLLVRTQTAPGAVATAGGTLVAWRNNGGWQFTGSPVSLDRHALVGDPKPVGALAVDLPADVARLTAIVAEQVAYATKVQAAATALAADDERNRQEKAASFAALFRPGTLFTGTIIDPIRGSNQRVIVEITAAANQQVSALLRNDGGWTDTRAFTGSWTLGSAADVANLTLRTSRNDYVDAAGPLLQDRNDYSITLQVYADGTVTSTPGNTRLQRVDPANAEVVKADVLRPLAAAAAATASGLAYRGTAKSRGSGPTEALLLRFLAGSDVGRDRGIPPASGSQMRPGAAALPGTEITASLESATVAGQVRAFHGTIVSNTYRVGDAPIRLQSPDSARVAAAGPRSPLGFDTTNNRLVIGLRVDGSRLTGQDDWFTYEFAPDRNVENGESANGQNGGASAPAGSSLNSQPSTLNQAATLPTVPAYDPRNTEPVPDTTIPLPSFPTSVGAYLLSGGHWMVLPRNDGQVLKLGLPVNGGLGELYFSGNERVPAAPAGPVTLIYVGKLAPVSAATLKTYPRLKTDPRFELVPLVIGTGIVRHAVVAELAADFTGFGARRVPLQLEHPADDVTLLHATVRAGRYAFVIGRHYFELAVQ